MRTKAVESNAGSKSLNILSWVGAGERAARTPRCGTAPHVSISDDLAGRPVVKRFLLGAALFFGGFTFLACSAGSGGSGGGSDFCGDGVRSGKELCDGKDVGTTCAVLGFTGGVIGCKSDCTLETALCCNDSCVNVGDTTCSGAVVQTCIEQAGCRTYTKTIDCASSGQQCDATGGTAQCKATCINACPTLNGTQCNAGSIEVCKAGSDGCLDWELMTDCTTLGKTCSNSSGTAQCSGVCNNQCTVDGAKQCTGNVVQTCSKGTDGCFSLTTTEDCAAKGQVCNSGNGAQCGIACTNECSKVGIQGCNANKLQTCAADANGCLKWTITEDCSLKQQYCKLAGAGAAKCEGICTNPCVTSGEKKCNANVIQECKVGVNGCQEWQSATTCPIGQTCSSAGGTFSCVSAPATGEDCGTVIPIKAGKNTVNWTATTNNYMTAAPSCDTSYPTTGPDVVLVYQSAFTGSLDFSIEKPASNRQHVVVASGTCGTFTNQVACAYDYTYTSMTGSFNVTSGQNYFFYVGDTTSGALPLNNPLVVTLAEVDCTTFSASAMTLVPANGSTTTTLSQKLSVDFDVPITTTTTTATVKLTGNKGTNITYTQGSSTQLTWTNSNKTLNINPGIAFPAGEVITVALDGFLDAKCNKAINKPTWSFTVVTPPCSPGTGGMLGTAQKKLAVPSFYAYYAAADASATGYVYYGSTTALHRVNKATSASEQVSTSSVLGYGMLVGNDANPVVFDNIMTAGSTIAWKLTSSSGTWATQPLVSFPTAPTDYVEGGVEYKGKYYLIAAETSSTLPTQIWSASTTPSSFPGPATLELDFPGETYCNGLAVDDKYFYAACGTGERLVRVDRTTKAVTLITNAFDLATSYANGLHAHDTNGDGTADFLYFKGSQSAVFFVCNPAGATPYADTLVSYGTSTSSYGLGFDSTNKALYAFNYSPSEVVEIK